jgi:hypothetical protein
MIASIPELNGQMPVSDWAAVVRSTLDDPDNQQLLVSTHTKPRDLATQLRGRLASSLAGVSSRLKPEATSNVESLIEALATALPTNEDGLPDRLQQIQQRPNQKAASLAKLIEEAHEQHRAPLPSQRKDYVTILTRFDSAARIYLNLALKPIQRDAAYTWVQFVAVCREYSSKQSTSQPQQQTDTQQPQQQQQQPSNRTPP